MPVMSTETAGDDQQATAVTIKHESSSGSSMHQLLSNSVAAATASSGGGGMGGGTMGGIVGSEHHSPSPTTLCGGCGFKITDRYYLVAVERAWHSECLRCGECRRPLDTALSCFSRQSRIYCRDDYYRYIIHKRVCCVICVIPASSSKPSFYSLTPHAEIRLSLFARNTTSSQQSTASKIPSGHVYRTCVSEQQQQEQN
jgi:hypothetical protein